MLIEASDDSQITETGGGRTHEKLLPPRKTAAAVPSAERGAGVVPKGIIYVAGYGLVNLAPKGKVYVTGYGYVMLCSMNAIPMAGEVPGVARRYMYVRPVR